MTRIILLRHGRSEANEDRRFAGHTDVPLAPLGCEQAQNAADWLCANEKIDRIYSSDLQRAMNTARPTAERLGLEVIPVRELREIMPGIWENRKYDELEAELGDEFRCWRENLPCAHPTGGESVADVFERTVAALHRIAEENTDKTVLIATHWTPVRCAICHALGLPLADIMQAPAPFNASIHILRYENGHFSPEELNITAHLKRAPTHSAP